jgi:hypothetical protein
MHKIGATKSGTVLIEMTTAQYDALRQFSRPGAKQEPAARQEVPPIALKRKLEFVRGCLEKLKPDTLEELLKSVKSVFRSFGGIPDSEAGQIVTVLRREGFLDLEDDGSVRYLKLEPAVKASPKDSASAPEPRMMTPLTEA